MKMITLLTKIAGKAQVLGAPVDVEYDGGKLHLALSYADAEKVLGQLAGGTASTTAAPAAAAAPAQAAKPAQTQPMNTSRVANANPARTTAAPAKPAPAAAAKPAATKTPAAKPAAAPPPEPEDDEDDEDVDAGDDTGDEVPDGAGDDVEVPGNVLAEMKKATKIKDVLQPLIDLGINTKAGLIAKCEELRSDVPVLSRIPDLAERVARAAEVLGVEAEDAETE